MSPSGSSGRGTTVHSMKSFGSTAEGGGENVHWTAKQLHTSCDRPHCICALEILKPGIHQNNIKFSHITENTLHFHNKHYPINSVQGNNAYFCWYTQNKIYQQIHLAQQSTCSVLDTVNTLLLKVHNLGTKQKQMDQTHWHVSLLKNCSNHEQWNSLLHVVSG